MTRTISTLSLSGRVRISRILPAMQQVIPLGFLEEEDYFGEEVLETNWPRKINAETVTDVILLRMSVPTLVAMLDLVPPLAQRLQLILDSYRLMLRTRFSWRDPEETDLLMSPAAHHCLCGCKILPLHRSWSYLHSTAACTVLDYPMLITTTDTAAGDTRWAARLVGMELRRLDQ